MGGSTPQADEWCTPSLSVVIPAFNEAESIEWSIRALREGLAALDEAGQVRSTEIVVVDDHSTDDTLERLRASARLDGAPLRPIEAVGQRGLGAAIRRGLGEATGDLVLYTDADLPFDPIELPRLIGTLRRYEADIVCGYRFDRTFEGYRRAVQSHAFNVLVRALLPINIRDVNFACKLLRRSALDAVLPELCSDGPFIDAEIVSRFSHHDLRVVQIGVDYFPRFDAASTLGGSAAIASILKEAVGLQRELRRHP